MILGELLHPCDGFVLKELLPILNSTRKMFAYYFYYIQIISELKCY